MTSRHRDGNFILQPTHWTHWVAVGFGSGLAPKAPGTVGTIAALPLMVALHLGLSPLAYCVMLCALFVLAVYCAERTQRDWHCHDPGHIVIDEWVGMGVTFLFLPMSLMLVLFGFVLFRFFDIVKPWPIRWLDRRIKGGLGNVLDDVAAGVLSCACLHAYWFYF